MLRIVWSELLESRPSGIDTLAAGELCFDGKDIMAQLGGPAHCGRLEVRPLGDCRLAVAV
jgi:hypothetical protein